MLARISSTVPLAEVFVISFTAGAYPTNKPCPTCDELSIDGNQSALMHSLCFMYVLYVKGAGHLPEVFLLMNRGLFIVVNV